MPNFCCQILEKSKFTKPFPYQTFSLYGMLIHDNRDQQENKWKYMASQRTSNLYNSIPLKINVTSINAMLSQLKSYLKPV